MTRDYIDFQDRRSPLAYFITFSCYGARLHGDERGTKDRRKYNKYGEPVIPPTPKWSEREILLLKNPPVKLDGRQRPAVESAITEVCTFRNYILHALQARTNHIHTVVSGSDSPERIMNSFKAYSTRRLRESGLFSKGLKIWSRHGSTIYLWTEKHMEVAVDYVLNCQGGRLPRFE